MIFSYAHHHFSIVLKYNLFFFFFFFNDTATTEIYTLSLHDALPILILRHRCRTWRRCQRLAANARRARSEEHTSELQSRSDLVCRLLLEKKKKVTTLSYCLFMYRLCHSHMRSMSSRTTSHGRVAVLR